jgi:hypothetical protein
VWQIGGTFESSGLALTVPVGTGFLDVYANALAAFSFRRLRDAYTGAAIRLRHGGTNAEADIGFDGNGDFDTAAAAAHLAIGGAGAGYVVTLYDQSGNGYDVTQSVAGSQPQYLATDLNGMPTMYWGAPSTAHFTRIDVPTAGSATASGFAVLKMQSDCSSFGGAITLAEMSQANDYNNDVSYIPICRNDLNEAIEGESNGQSGPVAVVYNTAFRGAGIHTSTGHYAAVNGSAGTVDTHTLDLGGTTADLCRIMIGCRWTGSGPSSYWTNSEISEVVIYLTDQTSNLAGIDANQQAYWGF